MKKKKQWALQKRKAPKQKYGVIIQTEREYYYRGQNGFEYHFWPGPGWKLVYTSTTG